MAEWYETIAAPDASFNFETMGMPSAPVNLFPEPSFQPDGVQLINSRSNTAFGSIFDQSKISASIQDVIGSVVQAGAKSAVQIGADSINKAANGKGQFAQLARNFQSTQTGAQMNAAAVGTRIQNFFANPTIWLVGAVGIVLVFVMMRK